MKNQFNWTFGQLGMDGEVIAFSNSEMQVSIRLEGLCLRVVVRDYFNRLTYRVARTQSGGVSGKFLPLLIRGRPPFVDLLEAAGAYHMGMSETYEMLALMRRAVSFREAPLPEEYFPTWDAAINLVRSVENGRMIYTLAAFPTVKLKVSKANREGRSVADVLAGAMFVFLPRAETTLLVASKLLAVVLETELGWKIVKRYYDACEVTPNLSEREAFEKLLDLFEGMVELVEFKHSPKSSLTRDDVMLKFGDFEWPAFKIFNAGGTLAVCECGFRVSGEELVVGSGQAINGGLPIIRGPLATACRKHAENCPGKIKIRIQEGSLVGKVIGEVDQFSDLLGCHPMVVTDPAFRREFAGKQRELEKAFRKHWRI